MHHCKSASNGCANSLLDFSEVLGVDEALRPQWRDMLENLAPFPTNTVQADSFAPGQVGPSF